MSWKWRKAERGSTLGQVTCKGKPRIIIQARVVLKSVISQGLQRDSPTKGSQVLPRVAMIGIPSLELREPMKSIQLRTDHLAGYLTDYMEESV